MSFIKKVVELVNENGQNETRKKFARLNTDIRNHQASIRKCIENKHDSFLLDICGTDELIQLCGTLLERNSTFLNHLDLVVKSNSIDVDNDVRHIEQAVHDNSDGLAICKRLLLINEAFQKVQKLSNKNHFANVLAILQDLKMLIYGQNEILQNLDCYDNMKKSYVMKSNQLLYNVQKRFESLVELKDKKFQNNTAVSIKVSKDHDQLRDTLVTLVNINYTPRSLCNFLLESVFEPITSRTATVKLIENEADAVKIFVTYELQKIHPIEHQNYRVVFHNLKKVFTGLNYLNFKVSDNFYVFNIFAEHMKEKFVNLLIDNCIDHAIPDNISEVKESMLMEDIREFYQFLSQMHFFSNGCDAGERLLAHSEKVMVMFCKHFCNKKMVEADALMKKDLHDTILISKFGVPRTSLVIDDGHVSKSALQLTELMESLVRDSNEIADLDAKNEMLNCIQMILKQYPNKVAQYHRKLLENIPQQAAIYYNNCKYLADWCSIHQTSYLTKQSIPHNIMEAGTRMLHTQVELQKETLIENLASLRLSTYGSELGLEPAKIVRQCLRQLEVLKNVWCDLLPSSVYDFKMSYLLNELCNRIIQSICKMEDIASGIATELEDIIDLVQKKAPGFFKEPSTILTHVETWMRLSHLKMILSSTLLEITESWSEGNGPLSATFKADEVKELIKAIFQNSDRRSRALSSIY